MLFHSSTYQTDTSMTALLFRPLYAVGYDLFLALTLFASCKTEFPRDTAADAALSDDTTYDFVDDEADVAADCRPFSDTSPAEIVIPRGYEIQVPDIYRASRVSGWVSAIKRVLNRHVSPLLPAAKDASPAKNVSSASGASPAVSTSLAWTLFTHVKRIHRACRYYHWNQTHKANTTAHPIADMLAPAWRRYMKEDFFYKHPILYFIYQRVVPAQISSKCPSAVPGPAFFKVRMGDDDYSCFPPEAAAAIRQALRDYTGPYDEVSKDDVDEGFFGNDDEYDIIDKLEPEEDFPDISFLQCNALDVSMVSVLVRCNSF